MRVTCEPGGRSLVAKHVSLGISGYFLSLWELCGNSLWALASRLREALLRLGAAFLFLDFGFCVSARLLIFLIMFSRGSLVLVCFCPLCCFVYFDVLCMSCRDMVRRRFLSIALRRYGAVCDCWFWVQILLTCVCLTYWVGLRIKVYPFLAALVYAISQSVLFKYLKPVWECFLF